MSTEINASNIKFQGLMQEMKWDENIIASFLSLLWEPTSNMLNDTIRSWTTLTLKYSLWRLGWLSH